MVFKMTGLSSGLTSSFRFCKIWDFEFFIAMKPFFMNGKYLRGMGTILRDQNDLKMITEDTRAG